MWRSSKLFALIGVCCGVAWAGLVRGDDEPGLQVGDAVPEFQAQDDQGRLWNSRDIVRKKPLVVFFYPSDFARCCTKQAERYRDQMRELRDLGVEVVGVSGDAVEAHRLFHETHKLNFALLSDFDGRVAEQFKVPLRTGGKAMIADAEGKSVVDSEGRAAKISRNFTATPWTFIIGKDGRILYRNAVVAPVKDSQEVLDVLRKLDPK